MVERGTENPCVDSSNLSLGVAMVTGSAVVTKNTSACTMPGVECERVNKRA